MPERFPHVAKPSTVTDTPIIQSRPESRRIVALWPLCNIHSAHDGDGIQYAVLTVTHSTERRAYSATLSRQDHYSGAVTTKPLDSARVGRAIPTGRFSQKSLQAAFALALRTLREQIVGGDEQLAALFTPTHPTDA